MLSLARVSAGLKELYQQQRASVEEMSRPVLPGAFQHHSAGVRCQYIENQIQRHRVGERKYA